MECVARTRELAERIAARDYDTALMMRGDSYTEMIHVFRSISQALPSRRRPGAARPGSPCSTSAGSRRA